MLLNRLHLSRGVGRRLFLVFFTMSILTLLLAAVGATGLGLLRDLQREIIEDVYPSVKRANLIAIESTAITLQLPSLSGSRSIADVERRSQDIYLREENLLELLASLANEGKPDQLPSLLSDQITALATDTSGLVALVEETLVLEQRREERATRLLMHSQQLEDAAKSVLLTIGEKTISDSRVIHEMIRSRNEVGPDVVALKFDSFIRSKLVDSELVSNLQFRNEAIRDGLRNIPKVETQQALQVLQEKILIDFRAVAQALIRVKDTETQNRFKLIVSSLSDDLHRTDSLFSIQKGIVENRSKMKETTLAAERKALEITTLVQKFEAGIQFRLDDRNISVQGIAQKTQIALISIAILVFAASIYIYIVYVNNNIIRRISDLSGSISLFTLGDLNHEVRTLGDDQITRLEEAVETLRLKSLKLRQAEVDLIANSEELKRSNSDLQQFAYITAHDLRAPLRGLMSLASWIEEDFDEGNAAEVRQNLVRLRGRVERMDSLLSGILRYSRAGYEREDTEQLNCEDEVSGVVLDLGISDTFQVDVHANTETILTGKSFFRQVLGNLISNVIKHHNEAHGLICVEISIDGNTGDNQLVVSDDGPGIPKEVRERALQMFQTLKPKDQVEASGIGLTLVKKLVDQRHGTVILEESVLGGLKVVLSWPNEGKQGV